MVAPRSSAAVIVACSSCLAAMRDHQRRYSSSKPPVPPSDGSRGIDASPQTPAKSVSASNEDASEKRVPKRRGKEGDGNVSAKSKHDTSLSLPSVPSTQHLHPHGEGVIFLGYVKENIVSRDHRYPSGHGIDFVTQISTLRHSSLSTARCLSPPQYRRTPTQMPFLPFSPRRNSRNLGRTM